MGGERERRIQEIDIKKNKCFVDRGEKVNREGKGGKTRKWPSAVKLVQIQFHVGGCWSSSSFFLLLLLLLKYYKIYHYSNFVAIFPLQEEMPVFSAIRKC